jgi:carbamate kinase
MHPLGLPADRFIIAEDAEGQVMGFGQLQQQNAEHVQFLELRTLIVTDAAR